jgi:tonB-linked outer membrane protein, susC/ragA family
MVTLQMKGASLEAVIQSLKLQTDYGFFYNIDNAEVQKVKGLDINMQDVSVEEVLNQVLRGTNLTYTVVNNVVIIKLLPRGEQDDKKNMVIAGKVVDERKTPMPGVTVVIKNSKSGVSTDVNGQFTLMIPRQDSVTLVFSFVGMKTKEVKWKGESSLHIIMEEDLQEMDEVVVTGYQTVNRRDMVGSHKTLKVSDILMPAYNSIDQMLQGQVAGLIVVNTSSRVGTSPKIKLRGTSTILGNQSPLWVVDGIVQEDPIELEVSSTMTQDLKDIIGSQISWLNPMDIETITVLKDASATAIYGSRASNGVIVVTTKKGKMSQLTINYSGNMTINTRPNYGMFNYMNSKERIQFSQDVFNAGMRYNSEPYADPYTYEGAMQMYIAGDMTRGEFAERKNFLETVNTDWFDLLTRSAVSHNHNLSFRGGNETLTYNISLGYSNSLGQEIGNESEKMTGRVSVDARLHKKVRLGATVNVSSTETDAFGAGVNPMSYATTTSRAIPAYDEKGEPVSYYVGSTYSKYNSVKMLKYNFINERDNGGAKNKNFYGSANLNFRWEILDGLSYEFVGGYTSNTTNSESYMTEQTFYIANNYRGYDYGTVEATDPLYKAAMLPFGGVLVTSDATQRSYNIQNKFLFSKEFNENHRLNAMLAMELRSGEKIVNGNTVFGYLPERGETAATPTTPDDFTSMGTATISGWGILDNLYTGAWKRSHQTDNYLSYFATIAYSLKNRYVFNFSVRNDVSNRFGQNTNNRFDPTYSFGFSWRVMDEEWLQQAKKWVHALNMRVTYGIQGNALTNIGPDLVLIRGTLDSDYKQFKSKISRLPNPDLSWERTKSWDLGVDLGLFNLFDLSFDYYWRKSNAVVTQKIAYEYGQSSMAKNGGMLTNEGVEFTLSFTPVRTKNWAFSVALNASKNWNELGKTDYEPTRSSFISGSTSRILKKGYPLGAFWSYSFAGISDEDGRPLFNYLDVPEEERSSDIDPTTYLVYSGTTEPDFTGGLNLSLRWKNLSLSSNFSLLLGGKKRLPSPYANINKGMYMPDATVNLSKDLLKRWQKPGDETDIPGFVTSEQTGMITLPDGQSESWIEIWENSDVMVADASFFRCNQLSLSWRMHDAWCKRIGLKSFSLSGSVSNLFVIASKRFNGFDPELGDSVHPKNFSIGINVGF